MHYFTIFTKSLGQAWPDEVFFPDDIFKAVFPDESSVRYDVIHGSRSQLKKIAIKVFNCTCYARFHSLAKDISDQEGNAACKIDRC